LARLRSCCAQSKAERRPDDDDALATELLGSETRSKIPRPYHGSAQACGDAAARRRRSRGDNDRTRWETVGLGNQDEMIVVPLEGRDVLIQVRLEGKLRRCSTSALTRSFARIFRKIPRQSKMYFSG